MGKIKEKGQGFFKEFKEFISKGNVIDMAIGVIIATAFNGIITSLVSGVLMPMLGLITGDDIFSSLNLVLQKTADGSLQKVSTEALALMSAEEQAVLINIQFGNFLDAILNFLMMAFSIFVVFKLMQKAKDSLKRKSEEPVEEAPTEPAAPTTEELLTEIRDLLAQKKAE